MPTAEYWVTDAMTAIATVSLAVPAVGPLISAGVMVGEYILQAIWPSPTSYAITGAIGKASTVLSSVPNVDLATAGSLVDFMGNQMASRIRSKQRSDHQDAFDKVNGALDPGDASKLPAQIKNLSNVMLDNSQDWGVRYWCVSTYITIAHVELKAYQSLIYLDALCGNVKNALKSTYIPDLVGRTAIHCNAIKGVLLPVNQGVLGYMESNSPFAAEIMASLAKTGSATVEVDPNPNVGPPPKVIKDSKPWPGITDLGTLAWENDVLTNLLPANLPGGWSITNWIKDPQITNIIASLAAAPPLLEQWSSDALSWENAVKV
jgi:hypothetical protein